MCVHFGSNVPDRAIRGKPKAEASTPPIKILDPHRTKCVIMVRYRGLFSLLLLYDVDVLPISISISVWSVTSDFTIGFKALVASKLLHSISVQRTALLETSSILLAALLCIIIIVEHAERILVRRRTKLSRQPI